MAEYFGSLREEASHLFGGSMGAGATTTESGPGAALTALKDMTSDQLGDQKTAEKFLQ